MERRLFPKSWCDSPQNSLKGFRQLFSHKTDAKQISSGTAPLRWTPFRRESLNAGMFRDYGIDIKYLERNGDLSHILNRGRSSLLFCKIHQDETERKEAGKISLAEDGENGVSLVFHRVRDKKELMSDL